MDTVSEAERALVLAEGERRGWPSVELDAAVAIESGWDPHIYNRLTNAGGLIGFMPFVLRGLGWNGSPESFRAQSAGDQAPWVGKYFDQQLMRTRPWRVPGDTYMALAAPSYTGSSDSTIVYPRSSKAWDQNPGWRGEDGEITAGSIRAVVLRKMAARARGSPSPKKKLTAHRCCGGCWCWELWPQECF